MPAAVGYKSQKALRIDRDSILLGPVNAGLDESGTLQPAETRTGAARLLSGRINPYDAWKVVAVGGQSSSAGGYLVQAAHVAQRDVLANASTWATIGVITFNGTGQTEFGFTGVQAEDRVKEVASPAITGKVRVAAFRLVAGTGTGSGQNGVAVPAGTGNQIHLQRT
jgi:hypothetical protein